MPQLNRFWTINIDLIGTIHSGSRGGSRPGGYNSNMGYGKLLDADSRLLSFVTVMSVWCYAITPAGRLINSTGNVIGWEQSQFDLLYPLLLVGQCFQWLLTMTGCVKYQCWYWCWFNNENLNKVHMHKQMGNWKLTMVSYWHDDWNDWSWFPESLFIHTFLVSWSLF